VKSETRHSGARAFIEDLAARGRHHFTSREARIALQASPNATAKALARLIEYGSLASPERGFYVVVPPEYRSLGCLPAEQFVPALMANHGFPYYAGLLSAAQFHGAAHHRPQQFQVMLAKNRRPIACGKVRVAFVARRRVESVPVVRLNTPRGEIRVSTPEATAVDLVGYADHAGGLDQVATVLAALAERIDPGQLPTAAATAPLHWAQRLGYLLEGVGAASTATALKEYVRKVARDYAPLVSAGPRDGPRSADWKILVNATFEIET
jgi:predicted transcriptional regulator of viral defense system